MSSDSQSKKSWLGRNKMCFILGMPVLFALAPFPGFGMFFPIRDALRGHPEGPHRTQPQKFVGLWIRDKSVIYDFLGQSFYLMSDGRFAGMSGMTARRWHFDNNCLFIDSVSLCGNGYQGNVTTEYSINFVDADQLIVTNRNETAMRGISGRYRRVEITGALKAELSRLEKSKDEGVSFKARSELMAIKQFENLSKPTP